jgi:hypothetical protein
MSIIHTYVRIVCLPAALLLPGLAWADEPPPAVQALLTNLERQMAAKPSYEALSVDDEGDVTITNLMLTLPPSGEDPGFTLKTAEITFSDITDRGPGVWEVGEASLSKATLDIDGGDIVMSASIPAASAEGWIIRELSASPSPQEKFIASGTFARKMTGGPVSISSNGQTVTIDSLESTWDGDPATGAGTFTSKISNVTIPESLLMLMGEGGMLRQLGYSSLNIDLASSGAVSVSGDKLGYDFDFTVAARDMGSLGISAAVADIPVDAYNALMQAEQDGDPADLDVYGPQFAGVVINGARLRFEDASILGKILPLLAAAQGMDEKTMVASIPPTLQLMLVQMQNEAFTAQVVDAVTRFLADPKSLTVSLKPPATLKVSDFMALQQSPPAEAINRLGLAVTAND